MAKAPTAVRAAVTVRGVELLALIAASEAGFLMLTQDEGAEAVSAGHALVDTSIAPEGDLAAVRLTEAGAAILNPVASAPAASNGFEIDADVAMPVVTRRPRESAYPFDKLKGNVALLVIHGDQDTTNPMDASQKMAAAAKAAGVNATYATVPGGTHLEAYLTYASQLFDFLDKHTK